MKKMIAAFILMTMMVVATGTTNVHAITSKLVEYNEPKGTMLTINIVGENKEGKVLLSPEYMQFYLTAGERINRENLLEKVQTVLDSAAYDQYEVVDFKPNTNVQWSYYQEEKLLPITNEGFVVPDYSLYEKKPSFVLGGAVIIQEKSPTTQKVYLDENTDVLLNHNVSFFKRNGDTMSLTPIATDSLYFSKTAKPGERVTPDELYQIAQNLFSRTKEYQEGYRLIKRLNTSVSENNKKPRSVFHFLNGEDFNYVVSQYREFSKSDYSKPVIDDIDEDYYISKNGDDYFPELIQVTLDLTNENDTSIRTLSLEIPKENMIEHLKGYINENGLNFVESKTGDRYWFGNEVKQVNAQHFKATYRLTH